MVDLISDLRNEFRRHKKLADEAIAQLDDRQFFERPAPHVNPVAVVVKHLAGNLLSRWSEFLTSDGEKPSRDRDAEFVVQPQDTRSNLLAQWETAWITLFGTLDSLKNSDLEKTVTIRGEPHTVQQVLLRGLTHVAYHTGQILYLVRLWRPDGKWLTIAPGQSQAHKATYRKT